MTGGLHNHCKGSDVKGMHIDTNKKKTMNTLLPMDLQKTHTANAWFNGSDYFSASNKAAHYDDARPKDAAARIWALLYQA
jgi:hypothetical protein